MTLGDMVSHSVTLGVHDDMTCDIGVKVWQKLSVEISDLMMTWTPSSDIIIRCHDFMTG